jgi:hypothetical protein
MPEGKTNKEDPDVGVRIIFKGNLDKWDRVVWIRLIWLRIEISGRPL